jgi:tetratricopeptide (TPR) repeat protein
MNMRLIPFLLATLLVAGEFIPSGLVPGGFGAAYAQQGGNKSPRVALVIGNATYPNADKPLTEPVSDARTLADELRRDGFDVEVGENLTREGMHRALDGLYAKIRPGAAALVFFSGYGIQSATHQSYMIPVDAQNYKEADVRHDGVSIDSVLAAMNDRGAGVKIAILDASRRNRFEDFRKAPMGLALPANPPVGTLVLYSAAPGSVARETANDHSPFVTELIKEMRGPNLQGYEVFAQTSKGVYRASGGEQNPSQVSSLSADFSFGSTEISVYQTASRSDADQPAVQPKSEPAAQSPERPKPSGGAAATTTGAEVRHDYELAEQDGSKAAWDDFLRRHPSGFYAGLARDHLAKLATTTPTTTSTRPAPLAAPATAPANTKAAAAVPAAPTTQTPERPVDPAVDELSERIAANPQDADAFYKRGMFYAKDGDFTLAIKDFDEALRLRPKDAATLNNRCWARAMISDLQKALADCSEAIQIRPGFADALDSRGLVNLKIGMPANAVADYNAALRLSTRASSLYGRGLGKKQTGDAAGANKDIAAAKALNTNIVAEFDSYGIH